MKRKLLALIGLTAIVNSSCIDIGIGRPITPERLATKIVIHSFLKAGEMALTNRRLNIYEVTSTLANSVWVNNLGEQMIFGPDSGFRKLITNGPSIDLENTYTANDTNYNPNIPSTLYPISFRDSGTTRIIENGFSIYAERRFYSLKDNKEITNIPQVYINIDATFNGHNQFTHYMSYHGKRDGPFTLVKRK
ncbi:MAG: hypothetical protein AABX29_07115 [Nanoarchaeota archaeon]